MIKKYLFSTVLFSVLFLTSCQRNQQEIERVIVQLDTPSALGTSPSTMRLDLLADPSSIAEFNCFAVMVDYPEFDSGDVCSFEGSDEVIDVDEIAGMVGVGQSIEMSVIAGEGRAFHLIGFKSTLPSCPSEGDDVDAVSVNLSNPFRLGMTAAEIQPGSANTVVIRGAFDTAFKFASCSIPLFSPDERGFAPISIAGLQLWLDAGDTNTITETGRQVTNWSDKSGHGNDAIASGASRPTTNSGTLNGLNVIEFDGSSHAMSTTFNASGGALTVFAVASTNEDNRVILGANDSGGVNSSSMGLGIMNRPVMYTPNFAGALEGTTVVSAGPQFHVFTMTHSGGTSAGREIFLNGISEASDRTAAAVATISSYSVGARNNSGVASNFWNGSIAEVLIYDSVLSDGDRDRVVSYLKSRWGLP